MSNGEEYNSVEAHILVFTRKILFIHSFTPESNFVLSVTYVQNWINLDGRKKESNGENFTCTKVYSWGNKRNTDKANKGVAFLNYV